MIKDLEIKTSIRFNLEFANKTILSCFFFFFLIIDLYLLIPAVIAQIFNLIAELVIPIGILIKEAKVEIELHPVVLEAKITKLCKPFCAFYSSTKFALFLQENNFLFHLYFFNLNS